MLVWDCDRVGQLKEVASLSVLALPLIRWIYNRRALQQRSAKDKNRGQVSYIDQFEFCGIVKLCIIILVSENG